MALSTYLPLAATLAAERSAANAQMPIFMAHGGYDDIIPIQRARDSKNLLEKLGLPGRVARIPDAALGVRRGGRGYLGLPG